MFVKVKLKMKIVVQYCPTDITYRNVSRENIYIRWKAKRLGVILYRTLNIKSIIWDNDIVPKAQSKEI